MVQLQFIKEPDQIHQLNTIAVIENQSVLIIGPYRKKQEDACIQCYKTLLYMNNMKLADMLFQQEDENHYVYVHELPISILKQLKQNEIMIIEKSSFQVTRKRIHKSMHCPSCSNDVFDLSNVILQKERNVQERNVDIKTMSDRLQSYSDVLLDINSGIGKNVFRDVESDILPMYGIESRLGTSTFYSYGRNETILASKIAAQLEMIERYSSMIPHFNPYIKGSFKQLKVRYPVINPRRFSIGNSNSFIQPYSDSKTYYWTKCKEIFKDQEVYLPEQLVYFDNHTIREEERFFYETSNGCALGGSHEEAVLYALLEAIERDAFLVHWYTKKVPKQINLDTISENCKELIESLNFKGFDVFAFDITLETNIPTVWVLAKNNRENGSLFLYNAAGAHIQAEKALHAALVEVASSAIIYEKELTKNKRNFVHFIHNRNAVQSLEDHVTYYAFRENAHDFYILQELDQLEQIELEDIIIRSANFKTLENVLSEIQQNHPVIYIANMENEITRLLNVYVTKAIIPTLQPMSFGIQNERINEQRIKQYLKGKAFNKAPHPFP